MSRHETRILAIRLADEAQALARAGEYEGATAYAAVSQAYAAIVQAWGDHEPEVPEQTRPTVALPEWCGECDGPDLSARWVSLPKQPNEQYTRVARCPRCNPHSEKYQAAQAAQEG